MFEEPQVGLGLDIRGMWRRWLLGLLFLGGLIAVAYIRPLYIVGPALVSFLAWGILRQRARTREIRQFAQRVGLTYLGSAVPRRLPVPRALLRQVMSISAFVVGDERNKDLVLFDCMLNGKGTRSRTVVAVRGQPSAFGAARFWPDLITEQVGEWALVYSEGRLLTIEEIEGLVSAVSADTTPATSETAPHVRSDFDHRA